MKIWEKLIIVGIVSVGLVFLVGAVFDVTTQYPGGLSSGIKAADASISGNPGWLLGYQILTYNSGIAYAVLYDHPTTATGTALAKSYCLQASYSETVTFPIPIRAQNGIYLDLNGTGVNVIVHYRADK